MGGTISNIIKGVDNSAKQLIFQIDPSILKLKNATLIAINDFETKIHSNSEQYILSIRQNFLIWLFLILIFSILILTIIYYLNDILYNLRFSLLIRQYASLLVLTIILFWIFFSLICSVFLRERINWFIFKFIVFCLFSVCVLLLIFIWFRSLSIYQRRTKKNVFSKEKNKLLNHL